ncbi:MAG: VOC family protein [Bacteroidetes bacterium]|nr:VOC family protein [Bacteroidota bacterium]
MAEKISRVILFVNDVSNCAEFYKKVLKLKVIGKEDPGWTELNAGSCSLALHKTGGKGRGKFHNNFKIVFYKKDVKKAKISLEKKGVKMGKIFIFDGMSFCDGSDPEGNRFQISDR